MKYLLSFVCLFWGLGLRATPFYFKSYDMEDGLSNNHVTCCLQDPYGFMWFGTRDGLNRFDSQKFHTFKNYSARQGALLSSWILDLAVGPAKDIWVSTNVGVQKYNYQTDAFTQVEFTKGMGCHSLQFDRQGNLWMLATGYSLVKYNEEQGLHLNYLYKGSDPITAFCITAQDQIWATTANGHIVYLDHTKNEFVAFDVERSGRNRPLGDMTAIWFSALEHFLLVGTNESILRIDIQTGRCRDILPAEKKSPLYTRDILAMTESQVWIATYKGIYIYDIHADTLKRIKQNKADPYSLSNHAIKQLYQDQEGGIWVCTDNGGVNYCPPYSEIKRYYPIPGCPTLNGDIVHDICMDKNEMIWIGTEDAGLSKWNPKTQTFTSFDDKKGLSQNCIHGLTAIDSYLWIGTHANGIDVMDLRTEKIVKHYTIAPTPFTGKNDIIVYLYQTRAKEVWVATALGMYRLNPEKDIFEPLAQFPNQCRIQTIFEDHQGVIWAGTSNKGLFFYNPATKQGGEFKLEPVDTNTNRTINHIHEDRANKLWFATGDGVKKYDRATGETVRYSMRDGLPSNVIYRIEEDRKGSLWISTANGLANLNPQTGAIKLFKKEHGLTSNQFNYNSSLQTPDGTLYYGTLKGMISFHPEKIREFSIQPKVYITQINYNDPEHNVLRQEYVTFRKGLTLAYDQSTFYIDYTSLNYQAPDLTQYAYCMEGLNPKWVHVVGENRVYFTKLPPGEYVFKVKAANLSGIWNDEPATFQVKVLPPWWLSPVAWGGYVLLALGGIGLLILWGARRNRAKMQKKMREFEHEKEKELYQAKINFFINIAHEIRTPLTLIKSPLEKVTGDTKLSASARNYLDVVGKNANRLLDLVNQLLDFRKTEIEGYKLNFIPHDIISLVHETYERFHDTAEQACLQMRIEENAPSLLAYIDKEACTKILSNLLSNAVKYAKSKIIIHIEREGSEWFTIDIKNDGNPIPDEIKEKIFEPFFRDDSSLHKSGTGLGLPLARSLAEMHEGSLTLETSSFPLIVFRLRLPVNQPNSLCMEEERANVPFTAESPEVYVTEPCRPTVLIVEDNSEMLHFLAGEVNAYYNVVTAGEGEEAVRRLKEYGIQLIISDIMMPGMDGFTLLKKIKTDLEFSHIPVILLTARNTLQSRMEGLELGADAYIDKPFSMDLLLTQIANLLNNRSSMRTYYFNSPMANLKSMAYTKADEKFLKKLNDIIYSHINDVDLDVDKIAGLMNLSRPTLYRKISGLSNVTPNELIKISRLKRAAELILQGDKRIYEIAEAVGFNSQSYFSRAFSKQFKMSPSQYAKENNIELK